MTHQPETAVTVDALARMLSAADVEINHGDYPTWDTLAESGQKQYRQAARYLLKRLHITAPAAVSAAVTPPTNRAAVLREAADRIDNEELPHDYVDMFDNGARWAARLLRRMADETATETPETPTVAWHILTHQRGTWRPWLAPRDNSTEAREDYDRCVSDNGHRWAFRLVRETSTFTVESEHQPAAGARQDGAET